MALCKFVNIPNKLKLRFDFVRHINTTSIKNATDQPEEITIPVPWGHVAGKWWGPKTRRPVLCLHGWQDNANTFDGLIPLLSRERSYLSIDFPGHGISSHLPKGFFYDLNEAAGLVKRIQNHFKWSKVSLIGHSYGSKVSFLFSACFPESVDFFVGVDLLKPIAWNPEKSSKSIEKMLLYDSYSPDNTPRYDKSDLIKRCIKGSDDSLTEKSVEILLQRGSKEIEGLYRLTVDCRLKTNIGHNLSNEDIENLAKSIKCNVAFIKAKGSPFYEDKKKVVRVMELLEKSANHFEYHELPGTHHLHLNTPEIVAPVINIFINNFGRRPD